MVQEFIRKATPADVEYLIANVRPEDVEEVDAFDGSTIRESLEELPDLDNTEAWEVDGKVVCLFGVTPVPEYPGTGVIWMLATKEFNKYTRLFPARSKEVIADAVHRYYYIFNYVHSKNEKSVNWLRWLGFECSEPKPMGPRGELFTKIS